MQHDTQLWTNILWESAGNLELPKCSDHFVPWNFLGLWLTLFEGRSGRSSPQVTRWEQGNYVTIKSKSNYSSHEPLSCFIKPRGNLSGMKRHLSSKMAEFHQVLVSTALNRNFVFCYLPSEYWVPPPTVPLQQERAGRIALQSYE